MATSRANSQANRTLSLTEELERLEQSITLTLQEIDHNFSRAHRIVTSSILPVVEQYAKHSEAVWEGSKFWKQFFEASANVSLSGYEEAPGEEDITYADQSITVDSLPGVGSHVSTPNRNVTTPHGYAQGETGDWVHAAHSDGSSPSSPSVMQTVSAGDVLRSKVGSAGARKNTSNAGEGADAFTTYDSPYEALKRELQDSSSPTAAPPTSTITNVAPTTPGAHPSVLPDMSMTPQSSPFAAASARAADVSQNKPNNDVLLHRVLDKTYRIAATPHTVRKANEAYQPHSVATPRAQPYNTATRLLHLSPDSSPEASPPRLRSDLFSPSKTRTPGISVQHNKGITKRSKFSETTVEIGDESRPAIPANSTSAQLSGQREIWASDSEDDDTGLGLSPPKTIQFHIPQRAMLLTPAREASKRIVEDLLLTAGGDITDESELDLQRRDDDSPSVIRKHDAFEDSF